MTNFNSNNGIVILDEYLEVEELIKQKVPLIFVTGGGGTGKSTFIKHISSKHAGRVIKCAPTGIAALNISGKTIHSVCRLPPKLITPQDITVLSSKQAQVIFNSDIFIIDEISMVTSNMLDGVDLFLQRNMRSNKPFGGKTVIIVGDMFQLPPIVGENASEAFYRMYDTPYFFGADVMRKTKIKFDFIELKQVRRQNDDTFIRLLNNVRTGINIKETIDELNQHCKVQADPNLGAVVLSPRNNEVERRNNTELKKIRNAKEVSYEGEITGKFKSDRLPSPFFLDLKVGAQVSITANLSETVVNGSVGEVVELNNDSVVVKLFSNNETIIVQKQVWEEFDYVYNESRKTIDSKPSGGYTQLPVKLAWASTIHKAQGTTLDNIHIDLGAGCFATGQLYVALSRCRSLEGITLSRPLTYDDVQVDHSIISFYEDCRAGKQNFSNSEMNKLFTNSGE